MKAKRKAEKKPVPCDVALEFIALMEKHNLSEMEAITTALMVVAAIGTASKIPVDLVEVLAITGVRAFMKASEEKKKAPIVKSKLATRKKAR